MNCHRCHGFMCSVDSFTEASGIGPGTVRVWRCVICGEIIDWVILLNRIRARDRRSIAREKKPGQSVRRVLAF